MKTVLQLKSEVVGRAKACNVANLELRARLLKQANAERLAGTPLIKRMLDYLTRYGEAFTPLIDGDLLIQGSQGFYWLSAEFWKENDAFGRDVGHYCANYGSLIQHDLPTIRERILQTKPETAAQAEVKDAYLRVYDLFISYLNRYAEAAEEAAETADGEARENLLRAAHDIRFLTVHRPQTFLQGLQIILLAHSYLYVKPRTDTLTFGNLDRILGELYEAECAAGTLDRDRALEQICHFMLAFSRMNRDTCNIVVGGSDKQGNYFENDLTVLFLKAQTILHLEQPSVSLKIRSDTSDAVWDAALDLLAKGGAMPSFLNDSVYIRALKSYGFPAEQANTFCNVGCYEATPYGNTFGGTVSGKVELVVAFSKFFAQQEDFETFDSFLTAWERYLEEYYRTVSVPSYQEKIENIRTTSASIFLGLILDGCIEKLRLPEDFGAEHNIFSVLFGGLGTITDSLLCVKHFVFDTHTYTLDELRAQVAQNYPDASVRSTLRNYAARFGSASPESNALASRQATFYSDLVARYPLHEQVTAIPALFIFTGDIWTGNLAATPDGRGIGDRYSYGAAASELLPHRDTTKVLLSTASLPLYRFPIGAPMTVNLMADLLKTEKGRAGIRTMVETYHREGGTHIQINIADPAVLRDAQVHPEAYGDLLIRISGHTEPFTRLPKKMQDALIARAELGC